ncbi:MAG: L,D-transpeptidase YcbB [Bradyrhizobium sp.]|nr:L,D-transpeptidase YcbB [Bradyrhizobium sp.]
MGDCVKNRGGFDRVLMAVAATFLTVSATSALAQADPARSGPAELAIDAAVPRPEPANVPPPSVNDFKTDSAAPLPDAAKVTEKAAETKPADIVTAPVADTSKNDSEADTAATTTASPAATAVVTPAAELPKETVKETATEPA